MALASNDTPHESPPADTATVLGACPHDCPDTCALVTTVKDGVAIKLQGNPDHSHTGGVLRYLRDATGQG